MTDGDEGPDTVVRRDRFSGGPAREFLSSMADDERIFAADLAVDRAHVAMLAEQDIVADDEAAIIYRALDRVEEGGFSGLPDGEDVHEAIETAVVDAVGPVGGKMHTARSRNDEVATCIRYRLRSDLLEVARVAAGFREQVADTAAANVETVMPGYTHLQPAQPTTVAHWLSSYVQAAERDTARLLDAYDRTNRSPLGAAAFAGTPFDVDRERTADLLGFDGLVENAMDAVSTRDFLLESVAALAGLANTLSGLAEDLVVLANKGLVAVHDDYASTSSIMPQKKNPDTLELVRATAGDASAALNGLLTTLKGLPRSYNRDLQNATGYAWEAVDAVTEATAVAGGAVGTATWPERALEAAAGEGFSTATGVADLLAMGGMPFRTAHEIVASAAEDATDGSPDLATIEAATREVTGAALSEYVSREAVESALDPVESVSSRDSRGGPGPDAAEATLKELTASLETHRDAIDERQRRIQRATDRRQEVVERYV
ncbi:argininosuccinate lyase [Halanaeroarchaeum sulfurireducens]|uniref:Argininosuccinate lyase n=1 Tax=Halanaeroarchaeum sulfurireducens TaxID=1604004 RepID=A0A0F7PBP5_9EURY|nr:argininosuccinate lyase [Halanaeroarchaeum sulfurireducens]AKH98596.1 argininosuccinate lyase [Halanaeroarchaeum sulfurireducens]ALG83038.1 argininosuccinate lyase [Halanaeroarchaeum sulfurireducens]